LAQNYQLIAGHTITSLAKKNKTEPEIVNAGVIMNDGTYKALFTGIVMGLFFGLSVFLVGFYAK